MPKKGTPSPRKGKRITEAHRLNISKGKMGIPLSEEHRRKVLIANSLKKGKHMSPNTEFKKGMKMSEETKQKMRERMLKNNPFKNKKHSIEARIKISANEQGIQVSEWKGFLTRPDLKERKSTEYNKWRMKVFLRDNFTCQFCGIKGCYLEAHHIKSFKYFPELRLDINNGVTLCKNCHNLTKNSGGRPKKCQEKKAV